MKIKKAMAVYENVINGMVTENQIKSNNDLYAMNSANCTNTSKYFKVSEGDSCKFKTTDGLWWDITNIEKPVIAQEYKYLDDYWASDSDSVNAFYMISHFDENGILRINDNAYEYNKNSNENNISVTSKLYGYIGNFEDECSSYTCKINRGYSVVCTTVPYNSCTYVKDNEKYVYDENGRIILSSQNCTNGSNCTNTYIYNYDRKGLNNNTKVNCDINGNNCEKIITYEYEDNNPIKEVSCDTYKTNCSNPILHKYDENTKTEDIYCASTDGTCTDNDIAYIHDLTSDQYCNGDKSYCTSNPTFLKDNNGNITGINTTSNTTNGNNDPCFGVTGYCTYNNNPTTPNPQYKCDSNGEHCTVIYDYPNNNSNNYDNDGNYSYTGNGGGYKY